MVHLRVVVLGDRDERRRRQRREADVEAVHERFLETARRKLRQAAASAYKSWLLLTVVLGIGFLVSQLIAWRQLAKQGVYIASNPHSSFFYLFTAAHGVHLLGGLTALGYLSLRSRAPREDKSAMAKAQAKADAVTLYWHFMDFLWLYLFVLLFYVR